MRACSLVVLLSCICLCAAPLTAEALMGKLKGVNEKIKGMSGVESVSLESEVSEEACMQIAVDFAGAVKLGIGASVSASVTAGDSGASLMLSATGSITLDAGPVVFKVAGAVMFELAGTYMLPFAAVKKPLALAAMIIKQFAQGVMARFLGRHYAGASGQAEATAQVDLSMTAQMLLTGHASIKKAAFVVKEGDFVPYRPAGDGKPDGFYRKVQLRALKKFVLFFFEYHKRLVEAGEAIITSEHAADQMKWMSKKSKGKLVKGTKAAAGKEAAWWLMKALFVKHFMPKRFVQRGTASMSKRAKPSVKDMLEGKDLVPKFPSSSSMADYSPVTISGCKEKFEPLKTGASEEDYIEDMLCMSFEHGLFFTTLKDQPADPVNAEPEVKEEPDYGDPFGEGSRKTLSFLEANEAKLGENHHAFRQRFERMNRAMDAARTARGRSGKTFLALEVESEAKAQGPTFPSLANLKGNPKGTLEEALARLFPEFAYPPELKSDFTVYAQQSKQIQLGAVGRLAEGVLDSFADDISRALLSEGEKTVHQVIDSATSKTSKAVRAAFQMNSDGSDPTKDQREGIVADLTAFLATDSISILKLVALFMEPGTFGVVTGQLVPKPLSFGLVEATFSFSWSLGLTLLQSNSWCEGNGPMFSRSKEYLYLYQADLNDNAVPEDRPCDEVAEAVKQPGRLKSIYNWGKNKASGLVKKAKSFVPRRDKWKYLGKTTSWTFDFFQDGSNTLSIDFNEARGRCRTAEAGSFFPEGTELSITVRVGAELPENLMTGPEAAACRSFETDPTRMKEWFQCKMGEVGIPLTGFGGGGKIGEEIAKKALSGPISVNSGSTCGFDLTFGLDNGMKPYLIEFAVVSDTASSISGTIPAGPSGVNVALTGSWTSTAQAILGVEWKEKEGSGFSVKRFQRLRAMARRAGVKD